MVNTGKPSGACRRCRQRKIKCDEGRPQCTKCQAIDQTCPGYDHPPAPFPGRFFRNETWKVVQKAQKGYKIANTTIAPREERDPSIDDPYPRLQIRPSPATGTNSPLQLVRFGLAAPYSDETAVTFFFIHFTPTSRYTAYRLLHLSELWRPYGDAPSSSPLHQIVSALALRVQGNFQSRQQLHTRSAVRYGQALRSLGTALTNPEKADTYITLLSAMLLGIYETTTDLEESVRTYRNHLHSVALLLEHRGVLNLNDASTLSLFRSIRLHVVMRYLMKEDSLGDFWLQDCVPGKTDPARFPGANSAVTSIYITRLRHKGKNMHKMKRSAENIRSVNELLARAYGLDQACVSARDHHVKVIAATVPDGLPIRTVGPFTGSDLWSEALRAPDQRNVWNNTVDVYRIPVHAFALNNFRSNRIFVQAVVIRILAWLAGSEEELEKDPRYHRARSVCQEMVDEICACLPNYIVQTAGLAGEANNERLRLYNVESAACGFKVVGYCLVASLLETIAEDQRTWLRSRLQVIADTHGFEAARKPARSKPILVWGLDGKDKFFEKISQKRGEESDREG